MRIKVNKHNIEINKQELINEKEVNVSKCYFEFSEEYTAAMVKKALFTKDNKTYEMLINNNECDYPSEILESEGTCVLGVYAYTTENEFTRFNPTPQKFAIEFGSLRLSENSQPITPSEMEQYQQALQNGLNEVNKELEEVMRIGSEVAKQGEYATEQGNYAKSVGEQLEKDKENGLFKGEQGEKGEKGDTGEKGDIGPQGKPGKDGIDGQDGKDYVLTEADKQEIAANLNVENDNRITTNEKDIVDLETYLDNLTPKSSAKGELVHIEDALNLPTKEVKVAGAIKQETTEGNQLIDFSNFTANSNINTTFENDVLKCEGLETSTAYNRITYPFTNIFINNPGKTLYFVFEKLENSVTDTITANVQLNINYNDGTANYYHGFALSTCSTNSYTIPTDISNIEEVNLAIYTSNNPSAIVNTVTITKPMLTFDENAEYEPYTGGQVSPNLDYQQPIEVLKAYNLFKPKIHSENGITSEMVNGKLHIFGTATNDFNFNIMDDLVVNGKYTFSCNGNATIWFWNRTQSTTDITLNNTSKTIEYTSDNTLICAISITNGQTYDVYVEPMIIEGTNLKPYLPYGCVGVKVIGKNYLDLKLDGNDTQGLEVTKNDDDSLNIIGTTTNTWSNITSPNNIVLKENNQYCFSINKSVNYRTTIQINYIDGTYERFHIEAGNKNISFTPSKQTISGYVYIYNANGLGTINDTLYFQVEPGDKATEIESYQEQIVYLDLKGNWVGKIKDSEIEDELYTDKKNIWLDKNVNKRIFTGDEDWYFGATNSTIELTISDKYERYGMDGLMCSHFHLRTGTDVSNYVGIDNNHTNIRIWGTNMTLDEFKAFVKEEYNKGTPITLVYQTKKTETKHLGELIEPIKTFEGTNNIQVLANLDTEIEVKYALDVKKYFDNKLASIQEQIL